LTKSTNNLNMRIYLCLCICILFVAYGTVQSTGKAFRFCFLLLAAHELQSFFHSVFKSNIIMRVIIDLKTKSLK